MLHLPLVNIIFHLNAEKKNVFCDWVTLNQSVYDELGVDSGGLRSISEDRNNPVYRELETSFKPGFLATVSNLPLQWCCRCQRNPRKTCFPSPKWYRLQLTAMWSVPGGLATNYESKPLNSTLLRPCLEIGPENESFFKFLPLQSLNPCPYHQY